MEAQWLWFLIPGFFFWMMFARGGACSGRRSRRTRQSEHRETEEVARLQAELDARDNQIDRLTRRLEALETIVTDEDRRLRREFDALQRG